MAAYTWPVTLPSAPEKGYSETAGANIIRTQTDTGPAKMRRRSLSPSNLTVSYLLTDAQLTAFETFVTDTINYVKRFNYTHPRTHTTVEVRIVPQSNNSYTIDYVAPGYWRIKLVLEVLP